MLNFRTLLLKKCALNVQLSYLRANRSRMHSFSVLRRVLGRKYWVSEVCFKLFFRYECHTFNLDFFPEIFSAPANMALVHLFCFTFSKFTLSRKVFILWKRLFGNFFYVLILFFVKQKILLRIPYIQKARDPTFLSPSL